jgi:hypothetical protein
MGQNSHHLPHEDRRRIPPIANLQNGVDLHPGERQPFCQLVDGQYNIYIFLEPGNRHAHKLYLN